MKLKLEKPLVFFDLETTGLNIGTARVVEISYHKVYPDGRAEDECLRVKPTQLLMGQEVQMHIPEDASAIHGIKDEDVKDCPTFKELAPRLVEVFRDSDIAGYNSNHYDVPLLAEEFLRAGVEIDLKKCKMIDAFTIFQKHEPRNLTAAYKFYCNKDLEGAHSANADTMATYEVLLAQLERYDDLPATVGELHDYTQGQNRNADFAGRIGYDQDGKEIFNFGKYKGQRLEDIFRRDPGYHSWLQQTDFPQYTKNIFTRVYLDVRK